MGLAIGEYWRESFYIIMKKLILHVGPHKTGSTYLQLKFMNNRHKLSEFNLSYPTSFFYIFGHHYLFSRMFNKNKKDEFMSDVSDINKIDGDVILSSETYSTQNAMFYRNIKDIFDYKEIEIVYFYRTPTDRLYSYWQEQIKHGSSETFSEYSASRFSRPYACSDINYIPFLDMLGGVFGQDSIKILDYQAVLNKNNAVSSFFKAIGSECDIQDTVEVVNAMLPFSVIEVIRSLNARRKQIEGRSDLSLREAFLNLDYENNEDYIFLKEQIDKNATSISLSDTYIDRQVHAQLLSKYGDNIVDELTPPKLSDKLISNGDWIYSATCMSRIEKLYKEIGF